MNYSVAVLGGVFVLSLIWYYFPIYGGVHWFTGPVSNVGNSDDVEDAGRDSSAVDRKGDVVVDEKRV